MVAVVKNLYQDCTQYRDKMLQVSPLHTIYFEECGNPNGVPVIFLHGGPGSGCNVTQRRFFDPTHYRIILLDQRGCGRSIPQGEVRENTTNDLVNDIERIRIYLGIARWHVFGGSWGSTLALAYAIKHTEPVLSLTLRGIFLSRQSELDWFLGDVKHFHPEPWDKLCEYLSTVKLPADKKHDVFAAYEALVFCDDNATSIPAAIAWNAYESNMMSLLPRAPIDKTNDKTSDKSSDTKIDGEVEVARARVQLHYIKHQCFVGNRDLLHEASQKLAHIPTTIVQGRYDMVCPPVTAWELSRAMPHASLVMVADAGHSAMETGITSSLVSATDAYRAIK